MSSESPLHVMVDLETLSLRRDAALLQVAAVRFEPCADGRILTATAFNRYVALSSQRERHVDGDTLAFWLTADPTARERIAAGQQMTSDMATWYHGVLDDLQEWLQAEEFGAIWSHGATFDLAILEHAYLTRHEAVPWSYKQARCTRTLFAMFPPAKREEREGRVPHDALSDCVDQALSAQSSLDDFKRLKAAQWGA